MWNKIIIKLREISTRFQTFSALTSLRYSYSCRLCSWYQPFKHAGSVSHTVKSTLDTQHIPDFIYWKFTISYVYRHFSEVIWRSESASLCTVHIVLCSQKLVLGPWCISSCFGSTAGYWSWKQCQCGSLRVFTSWGPFVPMKRNLNALSYNTTVF